MAEIYKNTSSSVSAKIFAECEPLPDDIFVTAKLYDISEDPLVNPPIDPTEVLVSFDTEKSEVDHGVYYFYLPLQFADKDRKYKIVWVYEFNSDIYSHITYLDIVTPYVSIQEVVEDLGLGSDCNDPNYKSYHELRMAEKYARKTIEYFTGQKFYLFDDTMTIMGQDSEALPLTRKLYQLHTLSANDQLLVDNLYDINYLGYEYEPTVSGFGLKINKSSLLDNTVYVANGMVPPSINDRANIFRRGVDYKVYGRFGWDQVPDDVEQAAIEIMKSYFAKDRIWKDKYINKISTADWSFQYSSDATTGTGSAYADKLLLDYVVTQMVIV
jgi:hypothetical protein